MIKIRLMRIGAKKKPFYRVVLVDERAKRTGGYLELLGTYNPLTEPKDIKIKQDRIDYWLKQGAQMSTGFLRIIGKAPQRPPRKPKKEKKTTEPSAVSDQTSEKPAQETAQEEPNAEKQLVEKAPKEVAKESAKSESAEAIGEVERTAESNDSTQEQGAKQTNSERAGDASGASRPDEPKATEASEASLTGEQANIEPAPESETPDERPA